VRDDLGLGRDDFVFLAFGHLRAYKELSLLIGAFAAVESPSSRLIIAGVPWDSAIRAEVADATKRDSRILLMLDAVPPEKVAELFGASDVAVFPRSDGWTSGSLILAMSMGVPVIAARRATYETLMKGDRAGWLFEPGSISSLTDCLSVAAKDPALARQKGAQALDLASRMSWSESAAMTASLVAPGNRRA
jgi:glycosyltransferase involved in cell wall biosynthesis